MPPESPTGRWTSLSALWEVRMAPGRPVLPRGPAVHLMSMPKVGPSYTAKAVAVSLQANPGRRAEQTAPCERGLWQLSCLFCPSPPGVQAMPLRILHTSLAQSAGGVLAHAGLHLYTGPQEHAPGPSECLTAEARSAPERGEEAAWGASRRILRGADPPTLPQWPQLPASRASGFKDAIPAGVPVEASRVTH